MVTGPGVHGNGGVLMLWSRPHAGAWSGLMSPAGGGIGHASAHAAMTQTTLNPTSRRRSPEPQHLQQVHHAETPKAQKDPLHPHSTAWRAVALFALVSRQQFAQTC